MQKNLSWLAVLLLAATFSSGTARADEAQVKRGEYLARIGDCVACHTAPGGKPFAGGMYMPTPFGDISVPNLTPDKTTGIGDWTDDQFVRAMHEGIGKNGEYLYPVFPFPWYTQVTRQDALDIKAYLFSLPPENAPRKPLKMAFPFNVREALITWRTLFFKAHDFAHDPARSAQLERGAYLVEGLGHCGECHNAHNVLGASQWSGKLEGGVIEGWYAPNLTSDGKQGIGDWSEQDLATFLKTGTAPGKGVVLGPMQETISESLHYLTDEDAHAIAAYLKSVPAEQTHGTATPAAFATAQPPGSDAYLGNCVSCHRLDGKGVVGQIPALAGNGAVLAKGPENVIRVILGGLPATHGLAPMPAIGASMSDQQVAEAAGYVRNSWGNQAPTPNGGDAVGSLRAATQTLLAGNLPGGCGTATDPNVARLLQSGSIDRLKQANEGNLLEAVDAVLPKVKQVLPALDQDATVNTLTDAYCRLALTDPKLTAPERASRLGNFTLLVWGQVKAPEPHP